MSAATIPILMYHSISDGAGPTSIPRDVFRGQMDAIAAAGWRVIPLADYAAWRLHGAHVADRSLVITFDDGFQDFAASAFPELDRHGFPATVFLPTRRMCGSEAWDGADAPARPLMDWATVRKLSVRNIEFAPHSRTHANLARLTGEALAAEVRGSRDDLEDCLGVRSPHFAPPYGAVGPEALRVIGETYALSVGVQLGVAHAQSPAHDAPRLEMHYYRDVRRFADFLDGRGAAYLGLRQSLRSLKRAMPRVGAYP